MLQFGAYSVGLWGTLLQPAVEFRREMEGAARQRGKPQEEVELAVEYGKIAIVVMFVPRIVVIAVLIGGTVQMARFRMWGLSLASYILALIPCLPHYGCVGTLLGIWGIVMLSNKNVKNAFR